MPFALSSFSWRNSATRGFLTTVLYYATAVVGLELLARFAPWMRGMCNPMPVILLFFFFGGGVFWALINIVFLLRGAYRQFASASLVVHLLVMTGVLTLLLIAG